MNILKKILGVIAVLTALMCILILLCALNPNITKKLADFIAGDASPKQTQQEEISQSGEDEESLSGDASEEEDAAPAQEAEILPEPEEEQPTEAVESRQEEPSEEEPQETVVKGLNGYEVPSESQIAVPEAVSGKSGGFQPITEKSEELPDTEGDTYVSELGYGQLGDEYTFDPAFYPYYAMLDDKGQHLYRQIFANANAFNGAFAPIEAVPVSEIKNAIMAVYNDHPELFWLNTAFVCKYDKNKICAELELEFNITQEEFPETSTQFYNTVNTILTQVQNLNSYEKGRRVHDILIENIEYDKCADMNKSSYSELVEGKSV